MGRVFDQMERFFREDDWKYSRIEDRPILRMGFSGDNGQWTCYAQAREEQEQFIYYSVCPAKAPEEKRLAVAEFLTRANYGLVIGNFELDMSDGEVRYKTSIDVEGADLTPALVKHMVYTNLVMMDKYLPGVMAIIYANETPENAIRKIEG